MDVDDDGSDWTARTLDEVRELDPGPGTRALCDDVDAIECGRTAYALSVVLLRLVALERRVDELEGRRAA